VRLQPQQRSTRLSKRTILFLSLAAILLGIVAVVIYVVGAVNVANCAGTGATSISTDCAAQGGLEFLIGAGLAVVAGICGFIGWIGALIKTAQIGRWGWFVAVLLLSGLGALIYGIAGPETRAAPAAY
jgi:hypothetical protein